MSLVEDLPYQTCVLNLEYVLAKNKEAYVTANMIFGLATMITILLYTFYLNSEKSLINMILKYTKILAYFNSKHHFIDTAKHDLCNPDLIYNVYVEDDTDTESEDESGSETEDESGSGSEDESGSETEDENLIISVDGDSNRRVLRSDIKKKEVEYIFDRDYNVPIRQNHSLGVRGKNWKLE